LVNTGDLTQMRDEARMASQRQFDAFEFATYPDGYSSLNLWSSTEYLVNKSCWLPTLSKPILIILGLHHRGHMKWHPTCRGTVACGEGSVPRLGES